MEKTMRATPRQLAKGMAEQRRRMPADIVEPKVDEALPGEGEDDAGMPADIVEPKEEELELPATRSWIALKMTKEMAEEETLEGKVGVEGDLTGAVEG
ncbi:uncharacterized protein A4U43_C02F9750 [Asparagus officinalis]|uniref:Uncharacterized protein n=1 Tax=Asparagus officinalis TaxID=4686 RepID=A0A5P1FJ23_ASPOF|nr:uncharacterized protein A4U43_C02F9750 [Asparagus officinalis]